MSEPTFTAFNNIIIRTPVKPLSMAYWLTRKEYISENELELLLQDKIIREALYLTSPNFLRQIDKLTSGKLQNAKKKNNLINAILKYLFRMSTRSTPFGLFAGCGVGSISNTTEFCIKTANGHQRKTRLDMNLLVQLSKKISGLEEIKNQLTYYVNTSLYEIGDSYRYIEYYYENNNRIHQLSSIEIDENVSQILLFTENGKKYFELVKFFVDKGFSTEESEEFINSTISNQILNSELEVSVSGSEILPELINKLSSLDHTKLICLKLKQIWKGLNRIDEKIGNNLSEYHEIVEIIESLDVQFDEQYLFQTDLNIQTQKHTLGINYVNSIKSVFPLLNFLNSNNTNTELEKFKEEYFHKYDHRTIPLCTVIDNDVGIGYPTSSGSSDINPLIDDIFFKSRGDQDFRPEYAMGERIITRKLMECIRNNDNILEIKEEWFTDYRDSLNWNDLPTTFAGMVRIFHEQGATKICFKGFGGSSSANVLARFSHGDVRILEIVKTILEKEDNETGKEHLIAEINHLPESRVGNVLMRPRFRGHEINFLSGVNFDEKAIYLKDIFLKTDGGSQISLFSKKLNKTIIPALTNAHNYIYKSLPMYHFLCDMQFNNKRKSFFFPEYPIFGMLTYVPRIEYNSIILREATWNVDVKELENANLLNDSEKAIAEAQKYFVDYLKMPKYVLLVEGDNKLFVNTNNFTNLRMLLKTIKNKGRVQFKEMLTNAESIVKDCTNEPYNHEILINFYKSEST